MRLRFYLITGLVLLFLSCRALADTAPDLLGYMHENLRNGEMETLESFRGTASILLFFEPDCAWCLRQSRALDELLANCPDALRVAGLGVHGNRIDLRDELRRLRPDYPAFVAGKQMVEEMDGIKATPMMLLADENGRFREVFAGYIPLDKLQPILAEQIGLNCKQ